MRIFGFPLPEHPGNKNFKDFLAMLSGTIHENSKKLDFWFGRWVLGFCGFMGMGLGFKSKFYGFVGILD